MAGGRLLLAGGGAVRFSGRNFFALVRERGAAGHLPRKENVLRNVNAPVFDKEGSLFHGHGQQVRLRTQMTNSGLSGRAAALVLRVESVARRVCLAAEGGHMADNDGYNGRGIISLPI